MCEAPNGELQVLRLRYEDVLSERDRLRNARASVTGQLGPLPASAAIVIGLAATVADKAEQWSLITAGGLMILIVSASILYSSLPPYRIMRAKTQPPPRELGSPVASGNDEAKWLKDKIALEQKIYGNLETSQHPRVWPWPKDMQEAFRMERTILNFVQVMFLLVILDLLLGVIVH
jgi:hypothetical protein